HSILLLPTGRNLPVYWRALTRWFTVVRPRPSAWSQQRLVQAAFRSSFPIGELCSISSPAAQGRSTEPQTKSPLSEQLFVSLTAGPSSNVPPPQEKVECERWQT